MSCKIVSQIFDHRSSDQIAKCSKKKYKGKLSLRVSSCFTKIGYDWPHTSYDAAVQDKRIGISQEVNYFFRHFIFSNIIIFEVDWTINQKLVSINMELQKDVLNILVTVGTTEFEDLVKFTDSQQFIQFLKSIQRIEYSKNLKAQEFDSKNQGLNQQLKYFKIKYQIGKNGVYIPRQTKHSQWFRLSDKISQIYKQADIIFCHGGAGTLLQNLKYGKMIIAVANDTLAGNHQVELIEQLNKQNYILGFNSVKDLSQNLQKVKDCITHKKILKKYPKQYRNILNEIVFGSE